jgi:sirohydrochlorin ferrochelatase
MEPDLKKVIEEAASGGAGKIIVHPFLLSSGYHVTKNIPETIEMARKEFPDIEFVYTEPLGAHKKLAEVILERIKSATD